VIENPILNSPFEEPRRHFRFDETGITADVLEERRPSSYFVAIALAKRTKAKQAFETEWTADLLADSADGRDKESEPTAVPPATSPTNNDVKLGFVYKRVPHVTLKSIANNPDIKEGMTREEIDAAIAKQPSKNC
jgi:hypothetical protein